MEHSVMTHQPEAFHQDDYSSMRENMSKTFYNTGLANLSNPTDLGFINLDKHYDGQMTDNMDHHRNQHINDYEDHQNLRVPVSKEDHSNYQDSRMNSSYSPIGLPHHNNNHFNPNMNTNFHFNNVRQQPYQQERPGYGNYHAQPHYYQNHYDSQMMRSSHENGADYYNHHPQEMVDTQQEDNLNLRWSNEPAAKAMKLRNMPMNGAYNDPALKPKVNINPNYSHYEQENDEDMYAFKRSQMMSLQQDLPRAPVRRPLEPQFNGISVNNMDMKELANNRIIQIKPVQKAPAKVEAYDDNDDDDDAFGEGKGRSTRGLRVLSLKVKEIVNQKKRTTYKEVAETLTHELRQKVSAKSAKEETKDEQNVKRRVYDALNVLIAAGVLRKEGKIVYCEDSAMNIGFNNPKRNSKESREKLLMDIQEARKRNKAKAEALHELIFKCLAIKNLIKTNKEKLENGDKKPKNRPSFVSATRIEVVQENPALKPKNEDVIKFPFIVLLSSSPENSMNLNMDTSQRQLAIESKRPFNIFGDIDVLLKMGLHYVSRQMFDEIIPFELQKFVPKYFLAALK